MKEVIFKEPPSLDSKEKRIADMHSVFNILNVLSGELSMLLQSVQADESASIIALMEEVHGIAQELRERDAIGGSLVRLRASEAAILEGVQGLTAPTEAMAQELAESLSNMKSVYRIVHKRLSELEARATEPDKWVWMRPQAFERQFREVFYAIEKNAKGRYRIFFNLARKTRGDYYIDLKIESELESGNLWIPLRLVDVLRDITANARKYTEPGGKVALAIYQNAQGIQVLVEDSGCGIPADAIEHVVEFGYRAPNVRDRPTMGGGFGLTKAAWLVHQWGGQLTIASQEGEGTVVRFAIPNKAQSPSNEGGVLNYSI